jgi:hypothetical protein
MAAHVAPGYVGYIDESGDEGFRFGQGSSDWFILSAVVCRQVNEPLLENAIAEIKRELGWPAGKHLHWKKLRHLEKKFYAEKLAALKIISVNIAVHKQRLIEREKFQERYRLYYYTARYLLERVTWLIRDVEKVKTEGDGKVRLWFSNRAGMGYKELREYLDKLRKQSDSGQDVRIVWPHLNVGDVKAIAPGKLPGLQIADAVAGMFYNAFEASKTKGRQPDYAKLFASKLYRHKGDVWGYGIKVVPREANVVIDSQPDLNWCKDKQTK